MTDHIPPGTKPTGASKERSFIERLRSFGRFYVVPVTEQTEWALDKWLREHGYKFSIPILPGETLDQAMKRLPDETFVQPAQTVAEMDLESACNWLACFADSESPIIRTYVRRLMQKLQPRPGTLAARINSPSDGYALKANACQCDPNPSIGGSPPCPVHDGESEDV